MSIAALTDFVRAYPRLFVLTGAGISAGSGIPTYRDRDAVWQRAAPITHQDFVKSEAARRRYWARSMAGWPLMRRAEPNAAHRALASLQLSGWVASLVTQNVDGLHQRAGSNGVIELHGNVSNVCCLDCGRALRRAAVQDELESRNPRYTPDVARVMPDGDAEIAESEATADFATPACPSCGGVLKPDVVFFGANVPRPRVEQAMAALDAADAMLVIGSSLMVYSGFRFCERAAEAGKPIVSITQGRSRADDLLALSLDGDCSIVLPELVRSLEPACAT